MPRKPKHLPYVRLNRQGRLQYYRRIPAELRHLCGNRGAFTVVLDCDPTRPTSKEAQQAWTTANTDYERLITTTSAADTATSTNELPVTPLSPRVSAGIAAEPLRKLLNAGDQGQITREMEETLAAVALIAGTAAVEVQQTGDIAAANQAKKEITYQIVGGLLNQLHIQPDSEGMAAIQQRLLQYLPIAGADAARRGAGDFSPGRLEQIAPPVPKTQVTFEELKAQWLTDAGGCRNVTGVGVGQKRIQFYSTVIKELIRITGEHYPAQVDIESARCYVNYLMESQFTYETKQSHLSVIKNLYAVAVRYGLLDRNPFSELIIKAPKNTRTSGYRPFTRTELCAIVEKLKTVPDQRRAMIARALLATGARSGDISNLRHQDIKQTKGGVWYFDFVDAPTAEYPRTLKGGTSDERTTPIHPWLLEQDFLHYVKQGRKGFIFGEQKNHLLSQWFQNIVEHLGFYETRRTTLHSFRGTFIDLMREAQLPQDVRRAMVGHSSRDVQDRSYGQGLQKMPDVLYKELIKVDLSWLPAKDISLD